MDELVLDVAADSRWVPVLVGPGEDVDVWAVDIADAPAGYDLLLPPGWTRVPLNRSGARRLVRRMVEERAGDQPRDTVTPVRVALERELLSVVDRAVDAGAVDLFMVAQQRHGKPVAATLTVTYVPIPGSAGGSELDLTELADRLRDPGTEAGVTALACGPAVRTVRVLAGPATGDALPSGSPGAARDGSGPQAQALGRADLVLDHVERVAPHVVVGADPAQAVGTDRIGLDVPGGVDELHVDVMGLAAPAQPAHQRP